jgi:isochorismate synthase
VPPRLPHIGHDDEGGSGNVVSVLARALREPLPPPATLVAVVLPAPFEAAEKFLRVVPRDMGFLWKSPRYVQLAGGGCAAKISAAGANRFLHLRAEAKALWKRLVVRTFPGIQPFAPVLFGGAAFTPDVPAFEPWEEFGEDAFSLPRFGYRRAAGRCYLTVAATAEELARPGTIDRLCEETRATLTQLELETATSTIERLDIPQSSVHHVPLGDWTALIESIRRAIRAGTFDKIVAARRCVVDLSRPLEDTGFMARVFAAYPECTHFAVRRLHSTFLGATPETLFRKEGRELVTHALAGTVSVQDDPWADSSRDVAELRTSRKNLAEHALVVQKICDELLPLSVKLRYASAPETRQVRNLVHLQTPISAELRADVGVFDLLAALHPTPAVGGFPAREAAQWIRQNEPLERGWYSGPLGWLDADDNGEFAVAIRCGVLTRRRAYVFAGAGIVRESDAKAEYAETAAKMTPLLRALGVAI